MDRDNGNKREPGTHFHNIASARSRSIGQRGNRRRNEGDAYREGRSPGDQLTFEVHDNTNRLVTFRLALADGLIRGETSMGDQVSKMTLSPVRSNRVYTFVGRADSAPVLLHKVEPEYTEEARAAKFQGTVLLEVEIEPNGRVSREHVRVARSLGIGLDEKAIEAVRQWTFKPAYKDRQPVAATVMIEVNFRL